MKKLIGVIVALALVAGLLVAGVVLRSSSESTTDAKFVNEVSSRPRTAMEKIVGDIDNNGLTKERALQAFSALHGPIPGVTMPSSDGGSEDQYFSGSMTIAWVQKFSKDLSDDERAAVRKLTHQDDQGKGVLVVSSKGSSSSAGSSSSGPSSSGTGGGQGGSMSTTTKPSGTTTPKAKPSGQFGPAPSARPAVLTDDADPDSDYQDLINRINGLLSSKLGVDPIDKVYANPVVNEAGGGLYGEASMWDDNGRPRTVDGEPVCAINIFEDKTDKLSGGALNSVLAHEIFHCYQFRAAGSFAARLELPVWVTEGEATWVMAMLFPNGLEIGKIQAAWTNWATNPRMPLSGRSYDGVGFFAMIGAIAGDQESVWGKLLPAVSARSGAYGSLAGGIEEQLAERWGPSYFRESRPTWDMSGPGVPLASGRAEPDLTAPVAKDSDILLGPSAPYAARQTATPVNADVVKVVTMSGGGRIGDLDLGFDAALKPGGTMVLCFDSNECKCPEGSEGDGTQFIQVRSGYLKAGISGGALQGQAILQGFSKEDFCKKKERKPKAPKSASVPKNPGGPGGRKGSGAPLDGGCGPACGGSNGDPHLTTLDGQRYSLQAVGEFTVLKSTDDSFEVQARQSPYPGSRDVSVNSSIGVKVGDDRVTISAEDTGLTIRQNGEEKRVDEVKLQDASLDAQETDSGTGYVVSLKDGTRVFALPIDDDGINLQLSLDDDRKGKVEGLLGNANGDPSDDLVVDGDRKLGDKPKDDDIYGPLADRWRVRQDRTLLDYPDGKNTDSFTDKTFPDTRILAKDVPGRDDAEAVCRSKGVTDSNVLESCIIDVALTGSSGFAGAHQVDQNVANQLRPQRTRAKGGTFADRIDDQNSDVSHTFEGQRDELIYVGGTEDECQDNDMTFLLRDPDGEKVAANTGCRMGRIQLPKDGTYTMFANATHERTGDYRVPLVPVRADVVRDAKIGDELSGHIDKKAEHDVFKVQSSGGNLTIHAGSDGCTDSSMLFDVIAPSGQSAGSSPGCLLQDIPMYDSGTYLIVVNQSETSSGDYKVRIEKN